jgi:NAD-dependent dihydropyrimidine dehydrogenase PreA subunit
MRKLSYIPGVVSLVLRAEECGGCGDCVAVCPRGVLAMSEDKAVLVDHDACIECGACARNCPTGALTVTVGVGCATALMQAALFGTEPNCDCAGGSSCCR